MAGTRTSGSLGTSMSSNLQHERHHSQRFRQQSVGEIRVKSPPACPAGLSTVKSARISCERRLLLCYALCAPRQPDVGLTCAPQV
jgi:hypothetical protein